MVSLPGKKHAYVPKSKVEEMKQVHTGRKEGR
jgi:hypothetical protein